MPKKIILFIIFILFLSSSFSFSQSNIEHAKNLFEEYLNEPVKSIFKLRQIISTAPESEYGYFAQAMLAALERKKMDEVINLFSKAIKVNPKFAPAYSFRGYFYTASKKYDLAIKDLNHAIRLSPNLAVCYLNRGFYYRTKNENEASIKDFTKTIELKPDYADTYTGIRKELF